MIILHHRTRLCICCDMLWYICCGICCASTSSSLGVSRNFSLLYRPCKRDTAPFFSTAGLPRRDIPAACAESSAAAGGSTMRGCCFGRLAGLVIREAEAVCAGGALRRGLPFAETSGRSPRADVAFSGLGESRSTPLSPPRRPDLIAACTRCFPLSFPARPEPVGASTLPRVFGGDSSDLMARIRKGTTTFDFPEFFNNYHIGY